MRYFTLVVCLAMGLESLAIAYDIPAPVQRPTNLDLANGISSNQLGTVIGGLLLAAAVLLFGLWWSRKRQAGRQDSLGVPDRK